MKKLSTRVGFIVIGTALLFVATADLTVWIQSKPYGVLVFGCGMVGLAEFWRKKVPKK